METQQIAIGKIALVGTLRSQSAEDDRAMLSAGIVFNAADGWTSLTPAGRQMLIDSGYTFHSRKGWIASSEKASRPFHYVQTHIPSGRTYAGDFRKSHGVCWDGDNWREVGVSDLFKQAQDLIHSWNRQYPARELWSYRLEFGPAPKPAATS